MDNDNTRTLIKSTKKLEKTSSGNPIRHNNYDNITDFITSNGITIRQGYLTQHAQHLTDIDTFIKSYFKDTKNIKNVLEIGFLAGHSSEYFLKLNSNVRVTSIDIGAFQSVDCGKRYIDLKYQGRHTLLKGDSRKILQELHTTRPNNDSQYDIILIDGSYKYTDVKSDITNCKSLSTTDTLIICNNVLHHSEYIKYWNKDPTRVWNESINNDLIKELKQIDIETGRGTAFGLYL